MWSSPRMFVLSSQNLSNDSGQSASGFLIMTWLLKNMHVIGQTSFSRVDRVTNEQSSQDLNVRSFCLPTSNWCYFTQTGHFVIQSLHFKTRMSLIKTIITPKVYSEQLISPTSMAYAIKKIAFWSPANSNFWQSAVILPVRTDLHHIWKVYSGLDSEVKCYGWVTCQSTIER